MAGNEQVLLQEEDFITSSPELLLGFVIWLILRTVVWRRSSAGATADSGLQPKLTTSNPTCRNTNVVRWLFIYFHNIKFFKLILPQFISFSSINGSSGVRVRIS